jgi:hypothetical protein
MNSNGLWEIYPSGTGVIAETINGCDGDLRVHASVTQNFFMCDLLEVIKLLGQVLFSVSVTVTISTGHISEWPSHCVGRRGEARRGILYYYLAILFLDGFWMVW